MFVLFAFLLVSCAVFAQDDEPQSEGTLLIVPRLDFDPAYDEDGAWTFDLGSTSLYTLFEGNLTRNLSFSVCNHWFAFNTSIDDAIELYQNTWRSDNYNWVDWANLTYKMGRFFLSAGKDYIRIANFEIEDYDYDSHWQMNSYLWNTFQAVVHAFRLPCPVACEIFPDQVLKLCPLRRQMDSHPLYHRGSPDGMRFDVIRY